MTVATAREVVEHLVRLTAQGPCEEMADVFSEDAVFEMPYAPGGPAAAGRESFREHLRGAVGVEKFEGADNLRIHETTDPELVVAEYRIHGLAQTTGKRFVSDVVMFARVRDGAIVWSRNYSNPLDAAVAFDVVGDLLVGLTADEPA